MQFCSECKYAKEIEFRDGIKIICQKNKVETEKQKAYTLSFVFYKKLNQRACTGFESKDMPS